MSSHHKIAEAQRGMHKNMKKVDQTEKLKNYLLGKITRKEAEKIDLEIISNKDFEESLIVAEEFLIEDFLEGVLTKKQIALFHTNFLISEDRKQQVKTIAQLKRYSGKINFEDYLINEDNDEEPNFFQKFINSFKRLPVRAFAGLLIVGLIGAFGWMIYSNGSLEREYAQKNNGNFSNLQYFENNYSSLQISNEYRSANNSKDPANSSNTLEKNNLTEQVFFNLPVQSDLDNNETFTIKLIDENGIKFTQDDVRPVKNGFAKELRFFLPKSVLAVVGDYQVEVSSNSNEDNKISYAFEVK